MNRFDYMDLDRYAKSLRFLANTSFIEFGIILVWITLIESFASTFKIPILTDIFLVLAIVVILIRNVLAVRGFSCVQNEDTPIKIKVINYIYYFIHLIVLNTPALVLIFSATWDNW